MSIITMATTKGGAGKTTVAEVIMGVIHQMGYSIGVIDADPNCSLSSWLMYSSDMAIETRQVQDDSKIVEEARRLKRKHDLVIIDTPGARSQATVFAVGCADLVIIPVQLSNSDVKEALKTYNLVQGAADMANRKIDARILFTGYTPKTNIAKEVRKLVAKHKLPVMDTRMHHLVAYKEMSFTGKVPRKGRAGAQSQLLVQEITNLGHLPFLIEYQRAS